MKNRPSCDYYSNCGGHFNCMKCKGYQKRVFWLSIRSKILAQKEGYTSGRTVSI